ncbi:hypothetical protein BU17DRAFT_85086 [Hysterangium stoloniferum]|nr:hypothetical protein BU17DRAFT_85086 [Hysterangium stoloniferum]
MSTDESTIPFPVEKLKAETLRTIAKDLGVSPTGKKEDLLQRMRVSSASGWVPPPPTPVKKRVVEEGAEMTPSAAKKIKTPPSRSRPPTRSLTSRPVRNIPKPQPQPPNPARKKTSRSRPKPKKQKAGEADEEDAEGDVDTAAPVETAPSTFDEYLSSGSVEVFISTDDLLALVGGLPSLRPLTLWKSTSLFTQRNQNSSTRAHFWLIPADKADTIMNVAAFTEANKELLDKEKTRREERSQIKENGIQDSNETNILWYSLSISRNMQKDALAVKLIKAAVGGTTIVPLQDAVEETGSFWINGPSFASQSDAAELNHIVDGLF